MAEIMSGSLETIKPLDLMQLFCGTNKSGVLILIQDNEQGEIHLDAGEIYDAGIRGKDDLAPDDAALTLLQWNSGHFEFNTEDVYTPKAPVIAPTQELLLKAATRASDAD